MPGGASAAAGTSLGPVRNFAAAEVRRANLYGIRDADLAEFTCPKAIKYYAPDKRLLTFEGKVSPELDGPVVQLFPPWSPAMPINPVNLVEAGFYYTGTNHYSSIFFFRRILDLYSHHSRTLGQGPVLPL